MTATHVEDGNKLLAAAAEENAKTWQFPTHEPATFTVTYRYKLIAGLKGDPSSRTVTLRLPSEVEVFTIPLVISDLGCTHTRVATDSIESREKVRLSDFSCQVTAAFIRQ